jgi:hypothetical protein
MDPQERSQVANQARWSPLNAKQRERATRPAREAAARRHADKIAGGFMPRRVQTMVRLTPRQIETLQTIGLEIHREDKKLPGGDLGGPETEPTILERNGEVNVSATIRRLLIKADKRMATGG